MEAPEGDRGVMVLSQETDLSLGGAMAQLNDQPENNLICHLEAIDLRDVEQGDILPKNGVLPINSAGTEI
jgi:hypothetical protein